MAIMTVLVGVSPTWADLTDSLITHWKLDETSGTIAEDSVGDNNGVLVNGPVWAAGQDYKDLRSEPAYSKERYSKQVK